jgi:thiol-disulfide isomerase/thioredoxin
MRLARIIGGALCGILPVLAAAESWETTGGQRFEGKLSAVYGPLAIIADKNGSTMVPIGELKDAELHRVAEYLAAKPASASPWTGSNSKVAKALKGRLQVLRGEKLVDFDPGPRVEPDFYLVYFGAEWCPPCRTFSPQLVSAYQRLKQIAPDKFEVVFVSSDRESGEQLRYVRHVGMPWPVLKFSQLGRAEAIERWAGRGIPCLVAVTREGEAVLHSYHGENYVGPQDVLKRFESLLHAMNASASAPRHPGMHRLAVLQHVRAAGTGSKPVTPYAISLDLGRYRTLETKEVVATLQIDEKGCVVDASVEPELPTVLNYQLVNDAGSWLFLPAVEDGRAVSRKVKLPLKLGAN